MDLESLKKQALEGILEAMVSATQENRAKAADHVLAQKELFSSLVSLTFDVDKPISIKAAWVLEWICTHGNLQLLYPYLDQFTHQIDTLKFDSAIRPCSKICEYLAKEFHSKKESSIHEFLNEKHIEAIVEVGFDWLLKPQKIAVRAYTMETLYLFGLQLNWIHPELEHLISTKIIHESKGCEARGKRILKLIKKNQKTR